MVKIAQEHCKEIHYNLKNESIKTPYTKTSTYSI